MDNRFSNDEKAYIRLGEIEGKVNSIFLDVEDLKADSKALTKLATIVELQREDNVNRERRQEVQDEKNSQQMKEFSQTLININTNISTLNHGQSDLVKTVKGLDERVDDIEKDNKGKKIDLVSLAKNIFITVITAMVLAWVLTNTGLK